MYVRYFFVSGKTCKFNCNQYQTIYKGHSNFKYVKQKKNDYLMELFRSTIKKELLSDTQLVLIYDTRSIHQFKM